MSAYLDAAELRALMNAQDMLQTEGTVDKYLDRLAASLTRRADVRATAIFEVVRAGGTRLEIATGRSGFSMRTGALAIEDGADHFRAAAQSFVQDGTPNPFTRLPLAEFDRRRVRGGEAGMLLPEMFGDDRQSVWLNALPLTIKDKICGLAVFIEAPGGIDPNDREAIEVIASMGAQALSMRREQVAQQRARKHMQDGGNRMAARAAMSIDAFWEADDKGRISAIVPLSDRFRAAVKERGLKLIGARLEGMNLVHAIDGHSSLAGLVATGRPFRDAVIKVPVNLGGLRLTFSGAPLGEGVASSPDLKSQSTSLPDAGPISFAGSLTLVDGTAPAERERRELLELVSRLERSRARERELRRESETLLEGLRILTKPIPSQNVFEGLLALLNGHLGFEGAALIRRHWQGHLIAAVASGGSLKALDWKSVSEHAGGLPEEPSLCDQNSPIIQALNMADPDQVWASAIIVKLAIENQPAWLICLHSAPHYFSSYQLGLASRLALLTNQALSNEAEKNKAIQSSKLATLGEMATGIAHEMNQPLAAISLAAQNLELILDEETPDTEFALSKIDRIQAQTDRASRIVNQMRVFARQSYDQDQAFSVTEHVEGALGIVGEQLRNHGVTVTTDFMKDEPLVHGDPLQFEQVMLNLFTNARDAIDEFRGKAREAGTIGPDWQGQIDLSLSQVDDKRVCFRCADNGGGFPEHLKEQLFDPFFTTKQVGKGTGLGLSISYGIIRDMGGVIEAFNEGDGAVVQIVLNIAERQTQAPAAQ